MFFTKGDSVEVLAKESVRKSLRGLKGHVIQVYHNRDCAAVRFDGFADLLSTDELKRFMPVSNMFMRPRTQGGARWYR